jgi:CRP-like cAMP-binding protein
MELKSLLRGVMLFASLSDDELGKVAAICVERKLARGETLAEQGTPGDELYIVTDGFMEVSIASGEESRAVVNLGQGQIIGEMSLVDQGPRSATVRAISDPAVVQVIRRDEFEALCEANTRIGYIVMKDIAADLSFKLRHRNLMIG